MSDRLFLAALATILLAAALAFGVAVHRLNSQLRVLGISGAPVPAEVRR